MTKRKPFAPNLIRQDSNPQTPEEVEAVVADYSEEIESLRAEVEALKKEMESFKESFDKKSAGGADPRVDKIFEALKKSPGFFLSKELL